MNSHLILDVDHLVIGPFRDDALRTPRPAVAECRLCGATSEPFASTRVLGKYDVQYFRCPACTFVQTQRPYWLDEAYASPMTDLDVSPLHRVLRFAQHAEAALALTGTGDAACIDYGGGYGLLTRHLRDRGFDCWHYDPLCPNMFAKGFEASLGRPYGLAMASEVAEHFTNPAEDLAQLLRLAPMVLLGTVLVPSPVPKPGEWWYYIPELGQHIAFYTEQALRMFAARHGRFFYTDGVEVHLFTDRRLEPWRARAILYRGRWRMLAGAAIWRTRRQRPNLLREDIDAAQTRITLATAS